MSATKTRSPLAERLKQIEGELAEARSARRALADERTEAKRAFAALPSPDPNSPEYDRAERAIEAVRLKDAEIARLQAAQVETLSVIAGQPGAVGGHPGSWADLAREIDLGAGQTKATVGAGAMLREAYASLSTTPSGGFEGPALRAAMAPKGQDRRFLYPALPMVKLDVLDGRSRELAVTEFRQTGSRTVTGSVERDPVATTAKAELDLSIELATESLRQVAAVVSDVPNALFSAEPALGGFMSNELAYQLDQAVDAHVLAQIDAADVPEGLVGTTLIEQVRAGVSAARANGANPSLLVVDADTAVALDTFTTGADDAYAFLTSATGSASPLWGLQVVELPVATDPLLIDPQLLGVFYAATGRLDVDPYSGFDTNVSRVRAEVEVLFHVRDASGAYRIATTP
jgi:hypothetical protein